MASRGSQRVRILKVDTTLKKKPDRLPWPRAAEEDPKVQLGVDVVAKRQDVVKIVHKFFKVDGCPMDELLQEVYTAIVHKNYTRSAHDPRKSSFGHYVYMVANNVCINLVHKKKRYDRERDSIDAPIGDDGRTFLETYEVEESKTFHDDCDAVDDFEDKLRKSGMWDVARFVRAVRTGASADVIKEALSWGDRRISNKDMRDFRHRVQMMASGSSALASSALRRKSLSVWLDKTRVLFP